MINSSPICLYVCNAVSEIRRLLVWNISLNNLYTDLDYADNVVLITEQTETLRSVLAKFYQTAEDLGLHLSWQKTKVQNLGSGDPAADITVANNTIEEVTEFRYLGSIQSSGRCYPDLHRRIGVASSVTHSMQRCWRQKGLSLDTKLRLYQTCVLQILLYGADTWTLLAGDTRRLQSFHMSANARYWVWSGRTVSRTST